MIEEGRTAMVEWAAAFRPIPGETRSGDAHVVVDEGDSVLLGVIDGLGHGPEAEIAASRAKEVVAAQAGADVADVMMKAHARLRGTRGVTLSLARLDGRAKRLSWVGVGNVEASLYTPGPPPKRETMAPRGGVVGYSLPRLAPRLLPLSRGDTLLMATDGVKPGYSTGAPRGGTPREAAQGLVDQFARPTDDCLVLVARFWGHDP
jgi:serine phosphatase RsbU (regulator of sigma subunit)